MKEREENMPELTGSITLCPSRKGFRSMRKGRSGKGNSGILVYYIRSRRVPTIPTPTRTKCLHSSYQYISFLHREPHQGLNLHFLTKLM